MSIVEFAEEYCGVELESWEKRILLNYEDYRHQITYAEWIRPSKVKNQTLLNIYLKWAEHNSVEAAPYEHFRRWEL
jgi:hypothetical protein